MRRADDTDEIDAMTSAVHVLICVPLVQTGERRYYDHIGRDKDDDVACRSRARFLVETLHVVGWQVTKIAAEEPDHAD